MHRTVVAALVTTLTCLASGAAGAGEVAPRLLSAQYVALGYDLGDSLLSASQAIFDAGSVTPRIAR
jgi:hypothetical protein